MADDGETTKTTKTNNPKRSLLATRWRAWLRALHRDIGYLLVGLTFVYAASGLAVNHIDDWNANYVEWDRTHALTVDIPEGDDQAAAKAVLDQLAISQAPTEIYRVDENELEILVDDRTLIVRTDRKTILDRGREDRFFLRVANWLHLNRGKAAWTYIADGYAVLLLFLASSGMFMIKGKKGLWGRGALLVALGSAVPILYVTLSGGP
ncbi:MAG: PepSY-associated TM helix domain-containing protein [Polyangiaceae bacterium]